MPVYFINMAWLTLCLLLIGMGLSSTLASEDPCSSNPCLHGGKCHKIPWTILGYKCFCTKGYTGARCRKGKKSFTSYL